VDAVRFEGNHTNIKKLESREEASSKTTPVNEQNDASDAFCLAPPDERAIARSGDEAIGKGVLGPDQGLDVACLGSGAGIG